MDTTQLIKNIEIRLKELGMSKAEFYEKSGVSSATYSQWNTGMFQPSKRKLDAVAKTLGVSVEYLMTGEESSIQPDYYLNDDAREYAQFLFENPEYKVLFDASRKVKKQDIQFVKEMIDRVRGDGAGE